MSDETPEPTPTLVTQEQMVMFVGNIVENADADDVTALSQVVQDEMEGAKTASVVYFAVLLLLEAFSSIADGNAEQFRICTLSLPLLVVTLRDFEPENPGPEDTVIGSIVIIE